MYVCVCRHEYLSLSFLHFYLFLLHSTGWIYCPRKQEILSLYYILLCTIKKIYLKVNCIIFSPEKKAINIPKGIKLKRKYTFQYSFTLQNRD